MQNKKYLFANWKMYLNHEKSVALAHEFADTFATRVGDKVMAVFPSALAFSGVVGALHGTSIQVGAQNAHWVTEGGYTGEVSAAMYKEAGAQYMLIGHSERRHLCHETNHEVRQKVEAALSVGLTPVICVGETEKEKQADQTEEVVEAQVRSAFHGIVWPEGRELIIAYEPVWAVGTGLACDPIEAERMHELIKKQVVALTGITPIILYGGSVKPDNVVDYLKNPTINGVLVGGASTKLETWSGIVHAVK